MTAVSIGEVRALLGAFRRSDVRDLWVRAGGWTIFLARPGGASNPDAQGAAPSSAIEPSSLSAPHLGVFRSPPSVGRRVAPGEEIAMLEVLDERRPIVADRAGTIASVLASEGALVEYGDAIVRIGSA